MTDVFKYGQQDLIYQLNQLAKAKDIVDIPQNSVAAAASAAASAAAAAAAAESDGAAATAASKAAAALKSLDARYLGAKVLPPDVDNNGGALLAGATYWDTVLNGGCLRVFQAGAWVTIPANVASQISSTPVGGIVAKNVQAALAELDAKKAARSTTLAGYGITDALPGSYVPTWGSITGKPQFAAVATSGSKGDVGLGNVDNTSDAQKPVSTVQKTALDGKAAKGNKADAGLDKVDNTSDIEKPVSIAQAKELALKAPINSPVFTGTVRIPAAGLDFGTSGTGINAPAAGMLTMVTNGSERFRLSDTGGLTLSNLGFFRVNTPDLTLTAPSTATIISKGALGYGAFLASSYDTLPAIYDFANSTSGTAGRILCTNGAEATILWQVKKANVLSDVIAMNGAYLYPTSDNSTGCGAPSNRFSMVYAATGAINTSDARLKTAIRPMDEAEISAAIAIAESVGTYKWLESIQAKGIEARRHVGATVQGIMAIMEQNGLDPFEYGFICFDSWDEEYSHRAPVDGEGGGDVRVREAGDLYSLRNDQLNLFIACGLMARMAKTEVLHAALESRVAALVTT
ncbi:tail fiber domain-containing protein [Janthinobacterium rivuli]|uniref:Tail fiber domain-containing protein n=1 Tax=Janthinobacterium rivuli TaxID=2751478 RepID=A0ABY8HYW9_9BURK|nr:tail fiber domain-containing protein [Janthinobacterium rivuli]WFR77822.1 tail fiber domain-containing protein [Janthinobacterium rivuli]